MNPDGAKQDRLVDLVRKLLTLAANSAATPDEAAAAAARASAIVEKYNLDRARIEQGARAYVKDGYRVDNRAVWRKLLLVTVAESHFCRVVFAPVRSLSFSSGRLRVTFRPGEECDVIGQAHNVEVVAFLHEYLTREIDRLADASWEGAAPEERWRGARSWKNAFRQGCVETIGRLLRKRAAAFRQESEQSAALVLVQDAALDRAVHDLAGESYQHRVRRGIGDWDGFDRGRVAGEGIRIQDAVRSAGSPAQRALGPGR